MTWKWWKRYENRIPEVIHCIIHRASDGLGTEYGYWINDVTNKPIVPDSSVYDTIGVMLDLKELEDYKGADNQHDLLKQLWDYGKRQNREKEMKQMVMSLRQNWGNYKPSEDN